MAKTKAPAKAPDENYQRLTEELDRILESMQADDVDIDEALQCYRRGLELVQKLEAYLRAAENTVSELKTKFSAGS